MKFQHTISSKKEPHNASLFWETCQKIEFIYGQTEDYLGDETAHRMLTQIKQKILAVKISEGTVRFMPLGGEGVNDQKGKEIGDDGRCVDPRSDHTRSELSKMRRLISMPSLTLISLWRLS